MRKLIKGNTVACYRGAQEYLDDYMDLFVKYFKNIAHHHHIHHEINKDAILMYSYFPMEISCSGCRHHQRSFNIPRASKKDISSVFFEIRPRDLECPDVDRIFYDGILAGYYCPQNNVFCTGDLAHEPEQRVHIQALLEGMEKEGLLVLQGMEKAKRVVTLGADPELETTVNGTLTSAFELPQLCTREKAYISHDGMTQPQRELRPDPADTPEELVENIRDLIKISSFFGEDLSVVGQTLSLGGHIHIGNASPSRELTMVLDYFLSPFNDFNTESRKKSNYGKTGDVRVQPHGFEYRTPPAAWLLTPKLAKMTLELTKNVVEKIINGEDVEVSDNFDNEEYKNNIQSLGFSYGWVEEFMDEISWAKSHINEPLAKTWNVEIPLEYKMKKLYRSKPSRHPFGEPRRVEPMTLTEDDEDEDEDEE